MALIHDKPNPLNYFDLRRVEFCPPYFSTIKLHKFSPSLVRNLDEWISINLNSRYYIGQILGLDNNTIVYWTLVGIENEKELSLFNLACPYIHN